MVNENQQMNVDGETLKPEPLEVKNLTYKYRGGVYEVEATGPAQLDNISCTFGRGARVLVAGANGAGKSTLLSIMGGKKMIPRGQCSLLGRDAFHDTGLAGEVMYCGDWWRTDFFFNISVRELIGKKMEEPRCIRLMEILQVEPSWRINSISDGQRRRCQLLDSLIDEKAIYVLDEITTDLDLFAREGLLRFLRAETEERGATIFYATHIFDCLADWATHILFFDGGRNKRCCTMGELHEYQKLVADGARCPLYSLMKQWVFEKYAEVPLDTNTLGPPAEPSEGPVLIVNKLTYAYAAGAKNVLKEISFSCARGSRVLVVGANGACKSTILSILGGKRMIPRGTTSIMGLDCFNDTTVGKYVMFCGDWWRTNFMMNLRFGELLGAKCNYGEAGGGMTWPADAVGNTPRSRHLAAILQVNFEWKINEISDGQRRRCQLLENLATPKQVYLMDEITSDLDLYAREGLLNFLKAESDVRGATILYATHIFDHLEGWATDLLHLSQGEVIQSCPMSEVTEYTELIAQGTTCPLYSLIRKWVYAEYAELAKLPKSRQEDESMDGRVPALGLAGPMCLQSG